MPGAFALAGIDGLEIAMKGGRIGHDDYFCAIRDGNRTRHQVVVRC